MGAVLRAQVARKNQNVDMRRLFQLESGNVADAVSKDGGAVGLAQIRRPALLDWNTAHPDDLHTMDDLKSAGTNGKIADWYVNQRIPQQLAAYGVPDTVENRLGAYRLGAKNVANGLVPQDYIQAYKEMQL